MRYDVIPWKINFHFNIAHRSFEASDLQIAMCINTYSDHNYSVCHFTKYNTQMAPCNTIMIALNKSVITKVPAPLSSVFREYCSVISTERLERVTQDQNSQNMNSG